MLIGLTGQIGAGKSTVAALLKRRGATVIDADAIGRQVVEQSPRLLKQLVRDFGREILNPGGSLNRRRLAHLAFASKRAQVLLNGIVHPFLLKELHKQVKAAGRSSPVVVIDAALLLDWGLDKICDIVLVVTASRETRIARMTARGLSREEVLARQRTQLPLTTFKEKADLVIVNNGTAEQLSVKIDRFWSTLQI